MRYTEKKEYLIYCSHIHFGMFTKLALIIAVSACTLSANAQPVRHKPLHVIFDTDIATDYDDVGAITLLHYYADKGKVKIHFEGGGPSSSLAFCIFFLSHLILCHYAYSNMCNQKIDLQQFSKM